MAFLYHRVPDDMRGDALYPLHELRGSHPELHERYLGKYQDMKGRPGGQERAELPWSRVPGLDCLWGDTVFLLPHHPREIKDAYEKILEREFPKQYRRYYAIDTRQLDSERCVLFLHRRGVPHDDPANWLPFDPETIARFAPLPEDTMEEYRRAAAGKPKFRVFTFTHHVLHRGSIGIRDSEIVEI